VRRVRRDDLDVAGLEAALTPGDDDPELPLQHLVALLLARVQMLLRAEAARREDDLVLERLAVRLGRGFAEDEPLARPRVLEHLPRPRHGARLLHGLAEGESAAGSRVLTGTVPESARKRTKFVPKAAHGRTRTSRGLMRVSGRRRRRGRVPGGR
jgi:hypothetical protein